MSDKPPKIIGTLVYLWRIQNKTPEVILAKFADNPKTRKRGLAGKRNGYGGGLEDGESIVDCAIRETYEESTVIIDPQFLEKVAIITFHNFTWSDYECHYFIARKWSGIATPVENMLDPQPFSVDKLPYTEMMESDPLLLPQLLATDPLQKKLLFGEIWHDEHMRITEHDINVSRKELP